MRSEPPAICTIIARNYLAQARVLANALAAQHPGERLAVLLIDDPAREVDAAREPYNLLRPSDLSLSDSQFGEMTTYYGITELATAVKPSLLLTLLERNLRRPVLYLDPDMQPFAPLDELAGLGAEHPIVLTPHAATPIPSDSKQPSELDILASGVWNLGFILVSAGSEPFLRWWAERVRFDALVDHANMLFTDQRWVDLAVGYFAVHPFRHPAYNVAYWNLHQRTLEWTGSEYLVDGVPLALFHFSGFEPHRPELLSKHQGDHPRVLLSESPALRRLCSQYVSLLAAAGLAEHRAEPYRWAVLPDETEFTAQMRAAVRRSLRDRARGIDTEPPPNPFDPATTAAFYRWLGSPEPASPVAPDVPRLFLELRQKRIDLQSTFALSDPRFAEKLNAWARVYGPREETIPDAVMAAAFGSRARAAPPEVRWTEPKGLRPGYLVAGYNDAVLGIGEHSRRALDVVRAAGLCCSSYSFGDTHSPRVLAGAGASDTRGDFNTNLLSVNANQLRRFVNEVGDGFLEGRYTIAYWAWETESPDPSMADAVGLVDEVWTVSHFTRAAVQAATEKPVLVFPPPVTLPVVNSHRDPCELGMPEGFVFLFMFDYFSTLARKNPLGLIEAFLRAFEPGEGPRLVLKTINGDKRPLDVERLRVASGDRPDVLIIDTTLSAADRGAMLARADCYVSLHRAEGFGLTMAEAMALERPVIATGYSGNLEFMSEETAYLVPATRSRVGPGADPYPDEHIWGEPDLDAAAELMRRVYRQRDEAARKARAARDEVLEHHGLERAVEFVRSQHDRIQRTLAGRASRCRAPAPHRLSFEVFGFTAELESDDRRLLEALLPALPSGWRATRGEGDARFGVNAGGSIAINGIEVARAPADTTAMVAGLAAVIRDHLSRNAPGHIFVEAGVVAINSSAIMLVGHPRSGRSTLVRELLQAGATYYSDHYAAVDQDGLIHPYLTPFLGLTGGSSMVEHEPEPVPAELIVITSYEPDASFELETLSLPQDEPAARREGAQALIEYMVTARTRPAAAVATALKLTAAGVVLSGIRGEAAPAARSILARCGGWPRTEAVELRELERHWQALGEEDPLWAILTSPGKRGHGWDPGEFMATGRADVTFVMDRLAERGLAISRERALDFGCGVGRLTQALAEHFVECEGVDLARAMIEHAQRRNRLGDRVRYHHNPAGDLRVFGDRSFDFALSLFTFQHMEPRLMRGYLHEIVRILRPGGIAYFSIPERQMSGDPQRIPERRMSGDPLPAEAWQAEISLRCELPRLVRGQSVFLDLAVRNVSPVAWPAAAGLNLGNHWRTAEGELLARDDVRVPIAVDLAPGEETHLRIELAAPGDRRQYLLELDLVQEDVSWFADRGSGLRQIMIETVASPAESCSSANLGRFVPAIEMHALAPSDVAATVKAAGAGVIASFAVNRCGPEWPSLDYIVSR